MLSCVTKGVKEGCTGGLAVDILCCANLRRLATVVPPVNPYPLLIFPFHFSRLQETDAGTRRNAFIMMFNCATDQAITFLSKNAEKVRGAEDDTSDCAVACGQE